MRYPSSWDLVSACVVWRCLCGSGDGSRCLFVCVFGVVLLEECLVFLVEVGGNLYCREIVVFQEVIHDVGLSIEVAVREREGVVDDKVIEDLFICAGV